jgi:glycosyltransferase involved in cell wall biosynthesis
MGRCTRRAILACCLMKADLTLSDTRSGAAGALRAGTTFDVSVLVCTRNRSRGLADCFDALATAAGRTPHLAVEIVVVDNASTDATFEVAQQWARNAKVPTRVLQEPRIGVAVARNTAVIGARGRIIAWIDDDCRVEESYFLDLDRHFSADEGMVIRGGRVVLGDPADLPFTIKQDPARARLADWEFPGAFVLGCNLVLPRKAFELLGSYDERFGPGCPLRSGEETEWCVRAQRAGIPIEYVPDMAVRHYHGRRDLAEIKRLNRAYHYATGAIFAKHFPDLRLTKHVYWTFRNAAQELVGGKTFDPVLGLTHRDVAWANVKGLLGYAAFQSRLFCARMLGSPPPLPFVRSIPPLEPGSRASHHPGAMRPSRTREAAMRVPSTLGLLSRMPSPFIAPLCGVCDIGWRC